MKRILSFFVFLAIFSIIGCSAIFDNTTNVPPNQNLDDPNLAKVVIPLPEAPNAKAVGLPNTMSNTNYYHVAFRNDNNGSPIYHQATATASCGRIEISVPVGIYDILLLAGYQAESGKTPLLLASSYVLERSIILGNVNQINMTLATFDIDITAPSSVILAGQYNVEIEINTKNPLIDTPRVGALANLYLGVTQYPINFKIDSIENNVFKYINLQPLTAPIVPSTGSIKFDTSYYYRPFNNTHLNLWAYGNPNYPLFSPYFTKTINFIECQAMPEVEIIITWPTE